MRADDEELGLVPDDRQDLPRVVEEANEILTAYTWQLTGAAVVAVLGWGALGASGVWLPPLWLALVLAILVGIGIRPVTREPRLARDVLERWDALRIERALESSGLPTDPRLEVAESMAERIIRHPSVDDRTRTAASAMVTRLRRLLHDLRRTSYLTETQVADERQEVSRSISDLQDLLDARVADILGQLARLHRTVVLRDTAALEAAVSAVEDLVRDLEAEREVDRLLTSAEKE